MSFFCDPWCCRCAPCAGRVGTFPSSKPRVPQQPWQFNSNLGLPGAQGAVFQTHAYLLSHDMEWAWQPVTSRPRLLRPSMACMMAASLQNALNNTGPGRQACSMRRWRRRPRRPRRSRACWLSSGSRMRRPASAARGAACGRRTWRACSRWRRAWRPWPGAAPRSWRCSWNRAGRCSARRRAPAARAFCVCKGRLAALPGAFFGGASACYAIQCCAAA